MPQRPLLPTANARWAFTAILILALGFAPRLPGATVITGEVTPALPWTTSTYSTIGNTGAGTLTVDGGSQLTSNFADLGVNAGSTGTATISGAASKWTNRSDLYVGRFGSAALRVEAGGEVSSGIGSLGFYGGSTGTATITGAGSEWTNSSNLYVGYGGSGALRVEAGAEVNSFRGHLGQLHGSTGTATITGAGSKWTNDSDLYVGNFGSGALTVEDGGHVTARTLVASLGDLHGNGTIAATTGAILDADLQFNASHPVQTIVGFGAGGTLTVTPTSIGNLGAGYKGFGSLTIAEGVAVSSSTGYVGYIAGSTGAATVSGAASTWTNSANSYVGHSGSGSLHVEAGGQFNTNFSHLGFTVGSTGTATITGAGSMWTNGSTLSVGNAGRGALRVEAGGQVSNNLGRLGNGTGSTGTATIIGAGSQWTNNSELYVGIFGRGALHVEAGGQVSNSSCYLGFNGGSTGDAVITGAGSKWTNSSNLYVGRYGSATLTITAGGLVSVRESLAIDAFSGNDSFVNMATGGMLALWGDADDSLAQFLGLVAGSDAIRYWNAGLASWTPLTSATLGVDYTLQYQPADELAGYTLLTVLAAGPPGDFNFDNRVDGADLLAWQRGDSPAPHSPADLAAWQANFGLAAATPATAPVPEPGTLALVGLAVAGLLPGCRPPRKSRR